MTEEEALKILEDLEDQAQDLQQTAQFFIEQMERLREKYQEDKE